MKNERLIDILNGQTPEEMQAEVDRMLAALQAADDALSKRGRETLASARKKVRAAIKRILGE